MAGSRLWRYPVPGIEEVLGCGVEPVSKRAISPNKQALQVATRIKLHHHLSTTTEKKLRKKKRIEFAFAMLWLLYILLKLATAAAPDAHNEEPPFSILVNNAVLHAVRTDLSEEHVGFTAEYQYADGDVVNVVCANSLNQAPLRIVYLMAGTASDSSTMEDLLSHRAVGFIAKLHSGHNNSYIICTELGDYTSVKVRLVMRTELGTVNVIINGMTQRPKINNFKYNYSLIEYKYPSHQHINVVCEVPGKGMKLVALYVTNSVAKKLNKNYKNTDSKVEVSFSLNPTDTDKKLLCASTYANGTSVEQVGIHFTTADYVPNDPYPLFIELPSNGILMEVYNFEKLKVIFYEFEDGETLPLKCGPLFGPKPGPLLYLQMKHSNKCNKSGCIISETLKLTHKDNNTVIACYVKEQIDPLGPRKDDSVRKEIRVFLHGNPVLIETSINILKYLVYGVVVVVVAIIVRLLIYLSAKKRRCLRSTAQELDTKQTPRPDTEIQLSERVSSAD